MKLPVLTIMVCLFIGVCGCDNAPSRSLREQVVQLGRENKVLKQQTEELKAEIEKQIGLLEKCHQEKVGLEEQASESMDFLMKQLPDNIREENSQLQEEIQALKSQIEKLQSQTQKSQPPSAQ